MSVDERRSTSHQQLMEWGNNMFIKHVMRVKCQTGKDEDEMYILRKKRWLVYSPLGLKESYEEDWGENPLVPLVPIEWPFKNGGGDSEDIDSWPGELGIMNEYDGDDDDDLWCSWWLEVKMPLDFWLYKSIQLLLLLFNSKWCGLTSSSRIHSSQSLQPVIIFNDNQNNDDNNRLQQVVWWWEEKEERDADDVMTGCGGVM